MAILRMLQGPEVGKTYSLDQDSSVIGRSPDAAISLNALSVSRQHARIARREGGFFLEDLNSSNGTFLNGVRVSRATQLADRDVVQLGGCTFVFDAGTAVAEAMPSTEAAEPWEIIERVAADPQDQGLHGQDPAHKLQTVLQVAQHLAGILDLDELLGKLLDHLLLLFPQAERACVLLSEGADLVPRLERSRRRGMSLALFSRALARQALEEKVGIRTRNGTADIVPSTAPWVWPRVLLCVPMIGRDGRQLGALQLGLIGGTGAFSSEDLRELTAIALQVAVLIENATLHAELTRGARQALPAAPPAQSPAFSSHTIVTRFPAPIALAYRRFCRQKDPATRLRMLFAALEAALRYLVTAGVCDLFHCLARAGADRLPDHAAFDFLRRHKPMPLGAWADALRETARALAGQKRPFLPELPVVCAPGGTFDGQSLAGLLRTRNDCIHETGSLTLTPEECQDVLRDARPRLEDAVQQVHFLCNYPLGFAQRSLTAGGDRHRYYLHSCMGARVANTIEAHAVETPVPLREDLPFLVAPDESRLLYLWPLLFQRVGAHTGRHTLYVFEDIPDRHRPFLSEVRCAAIDARDEWRQVLRQPPPPGLAWLLEGRRDPPIVLEVPPGLRLGQRLSPSAGGKLVGRVLGSNRLLAVAATGGFSTVYVAENLASGERVAVKVLESPEAQRHLARFRQEFEKLRRAGEHPNIIRCFEWGNPILGDRECPWYSMEFAVGGDLSGRIEERRAECAGAMPWDSPPLRAEVAREFQAVAAAVAHLHGLGIVHRDVKPGNVLIMADGELRLTDFGLVKDLNFELPQTLMIPRTSTGAVLGTRHYMAPEQERGQEVEKPADVYALGVLLAELATGERPLPDSHVAEGSTLNICPAVRRLPAPLRKFILHCTEVRPAQRPPDGQAVADEFARLMAEVPEPGTTTLT